MTLQRLPLTSMCESAPVAGIVVLLCGLGMIASALGGAEDFLGAVGLQAAHPTDDDSSRFARSAVGGRLCRASAPMCETNVVGGAQRDREAWIRPLLGQEQGSRGEGPASPMPSRRRARADVRNELMVAANLARHRLEPRVVTPWDAPEPPLRHGDQ